VGDTVAVTVMGDGFVYVKGDVIVKPPVGIVKV